MKIVSTDDIHVNNLKFFIYGDSGVGKTSLIKTVENPIVISTEQGLLPLRGHNIDSIDITKDDEGNVIESSVMRLKKLKETYLWLKEEKRDYEWIFIDTISEINQLVVEYLKTKFPDRKDSMVLWGENFTMVKKVIEQFRDLPGYNVCFLCHEVADKDDIGRKCYAPDLYGKISAKVSIYFDEVFRLIVVKKDDEAKRVLITGQYENSMAKDRSDSLELFEPADLGLVTGKILEA